ncbi:ABC transporter ATP-binding protein [Trueperella pecoris]|uniref:ABC transporter ATP-binding protein n=1 Tax=Trueperella pecoris TaxID=2733571 RepID=A0A7M1QZ24_9ACTO|nr:ABC transporter ATP-binding protein [Trueperella pecoris]QOR47279.1 ABC transporter ATP-binding protein [Trueperella pecoris]
MRNFFTLMPLIRERGRRATTRDVRGRAINERRFEVGPQPRRWPDALEFEAIPEMDPTKLLRSSIAKNATFIAVTALVSMVVFGASVLVSWALGRALDAGIERGLTTDLLPGVALLVGVILFRTLGAISEPLLIVTSMRANIGWSLAMVRRMAGVRGGGRKAMPSGEMVAAVTTDAQKIGQFLYMLPELVAGTFSFVLTVVLMLRINVPLGLVVAIGLPLAIGLMTFLIKPLQKRLDAQREERGKLTTLASDAVVGLRVLRGVGGEDIYAKRYALQSEKVCETGIRAAGLQAFMRGLTTAVPGVVTAAIVGGGLWEVFHGSMTYGELVAFYGYTMFMVVPIWIATGFLQFYTDAKVAAGRIAKVMAIEPLTSDAGVDPSLTSSLPRNDAVGAASERTPADRRCEFDWAGAYLLDGKTGVEIRPGLHTVVVSAAPEASAELVERLARIDDHDDVTARWEGTAPVPLTAFALDEVRRGVVLSDAIAQLFQGRLRSNLEANNAAWPLPRKVAEQMADTGDGSGIASRKHKDNPVALADNELTLAMIAADATDIIASLEDGVDGYVAERGRSLSGGQRQRVALARAILTEAPVLLLIEPTSAVDSHTESRIAQRLHLERRGRTTVVVSASPIILGEADEVIFVGADGRELARGTHAELLDDSRYYGVVHREGDQSGGESPGGGAGHTAGAGEGKEN